MRIAFKWHNPTYIKPRHEERIVLVEVCDTKYERLCTAIYIRETKQWFEMLNNRETGKELFNVTAWSYIPEIDI